MLREHPGQPRVLPILSIDHHPDVYLRECILSLAVGLNPVIKELDFFIHTALQRVVHRFNASRSGRRFLDDLIRFLIFKGDCCCRNLGGAVMNLQ